MSAHEIASSIAHQPKMRITLRLHLVSEKERSPVMHAWIARIMIPTGSQNFLKIVSGNGPIDTAHAHLLSHMSITLGQGSKNRSIRRT